MIGLILSIAFILIVLIFLEDYIKKYNKYIYLLIGLILILVAGFKDIYSVRDAPNYVYFFENYDDPVLSKTVEFSYLWISRLLNHIFHDAHSIFLLYAIIGVSLKMVAIRRLSNLYFMPLLIYVSYYYILHDLTQIRAAVASGFFLLAVSYQIKEQRKIACALMACATFFHYSALCLFPILFLSNNDMSKRSKIIWASLIPLGYIIYFLHINLILIIPIPFIASKIEAYQSMAETGIFGDEINVFNLVFLVRIAIWYYNIFFIDTIKNFTNGANLILKIDAISLTSFPAFAVLPVIAFRVGELYGIIEIISMTYIYYTIKQNIAGKILVSAIGIILLCITIFYNQLIV